MERTRQRRRALTRLAAALVTSSLAVGLTVLAPGTVARPAAAAGASPTVDGQYSETGPVAAGTAAVLQVTGRGGVPASGVGAVALNVTVTNPTASSFLTVYPTGADRPNAANLVFSAGQTVPNMVVVKVGTGGTVSMFNYGGTTDVVVDVLGWFPAGAAFTGITPARLVDTRTGYPTIDGAVAGVGAIGPAGTLDVPVAGRAGLPASGVGAVALNVTATNPTAASYLTVHPAGTSRPTAANLNVVAGQSVPNMVMAKVGAGGRVSIFNYAGTTDVVVDVLGWFPASGSFTGLTPARLLDTRAGLPTVDGQASGAGRVGPGSVTELSVLGRGGVPPSGVGAVALNVTVTNPTDASYLTAYPAGEARPTAANLNFVAGQTVPNMVIVTLGAGGRVSLFNYAGATDVVVDVLGWFPAGGAYGGLTPARLMDSRLGPLVPPAPIGPVRSQLLVRPALHQMAGVDRIAIWVCSVPTDTVHGSYSFDDTRLPIDGAVVAAWATSTVTPYFHRASGGRYRPVFAAVGRIALDATEGPRDCLERATAATGRPYTNVVAVDDTRRGDGFGGAGLIASSDRFAFDLFDVPPAESQRGLWIGGRSVDTASIYGAPSVGVLAHEIGHTLHWPHSFSGATSSEYDNPVDLMSDISVEVCRRDGFGGSLAWACGMQHALAFDRFAAGWIDDAQVAVHTAGTSIVTLSSPTAGGTQFVAVPDVQHPRALLTIEARPAAGDDRPLAESGVAIHVVDQRSGACDEGAFFGACLSSARRQRQAPYAPGDAYAHVIGVGESVVVQGVTVTVTGTSSDVVTTGTAYTVVVDGAFTA